MSATKGMVLHVARAVLEYTVDTGQTPKSLPGKEFFGAMEHAVANRNDEHALALLDELMRQTDIGLASGRFCNRHERLDPLCARVWRCLERNGLRSGPYRPYCPEQPQPVFEWRQEA
jgi:hypothetical protein